MRPTRSQRPQGGTDRWKVSHLRGARAELSERPPPRKTLFHVTRRGGPESLGSAPRFSPGESPTAATRPPGRGRFTAGGRGVHPAAHALRWDARR